MMRKILQLSALLLLLMACNGLQVSEMLNQIDSLVVREQYDSACMLLKEVAKAPMTAEEQAHYFLLNTSWAILPTNRCHQTHCWTWPLYIIIRWRIIRNLQMHITTNLVDIEFVENTHKRYNYVRRQNNRH